MRRSEDKPSLMASLEKFKAMGHIRRNSLPQITNLCEYDCMLTCQEYENQEGQKIQINFLHFTHKQKPHSFKINIPDVAYCSTAFHQMHWRSSLDKQIEVVLGDRVDISMAVNCLDYLNPGLEEKAKEKLLESKGQAKSQSKLQKKEKKEEMKQDCIDLDNEDEEKRSNFGSDEDSLGGKQIEPVRKPQYPPPPNNYRINDHGPRDHRNLLDYSESTKILITCKLIEFLKNKDNRMRKIPQIREYLKSQRFNIPDKPLKELIGELCISSVMDKTRGFLLKQTYLSEQQRFQRRSQEQKLRAEKTGKQKQKRKRGKKQAKIFANYSTVAQQEDRIQQTLSPFEELQRKSARKRTQPKKGAKVEYG